MLEGKLLGHIISAGGIKIVPNRVDAIQKIEIPKNKKSIQSFISRKKNLRCFVPNFVEIIRPITNMLKKDDVIKWSLEEKSVFHRIKKDLVAAPVLVIPDYSKECFIFSFASKETIVAVLLQKNEEGHEQPIAFFSKSLRDVELKYDILEKKAYVLVKDLKAFRVYMLQCNITTYVPSSSVKEILVQPDSEGKRGKWIVKLLEYDLDIKPTRMIKGRGLAKLLSESNCKVLELHHTFTQSDAPMTQFGKDIMQVFENYSSSPWYRDVIYFL
jgi:hypothetical protein